VLLLLGVYEESSLGTTLITAILCNLHDCIQAPNCSKRCSRNGAEWKLITPKL
jgi:hypothetical protein